MESERGEEEEEEETESAGQERKVGLKSHRRSGASGGDGEYELGGQREEEGSKRRRRTSVCGGAFEWERKEGGKETLTQYDHLIMQQFMFRPVIVMIQQLPFVLSLLQSYLHFFWKFKDDIFSQTGWGFRFFWTRFGLSLSCIPSCARQRAC